MKKYNRLKKMLLKELVVFGVTVAVFGGMVFYVSNYVRNQETRKKTVESSIQQTDSQMRSVKENYEKANVSIELYKDIVSKLSDGSLGTGDEALRDVLIHLKDKYRLSQLNLKLDPAKPYDDAAVKNSTVVDVTYSKVGLKLGAMSDVHLYSFLFDLNQMLNGIVKVSSLSLSREKQFTDDMLFRISKGALPQTVGAELVFYWLGVEEKV